MTKLISLFKSVAQLPRLILASFTSDVKVPVMKGGRTYHLTLGDLVTWAYNPSGFDIAGFETWLNARSVRFDENQTLTPAQKQRVARNTDCVLSDARMTISNLFDDDGAALPDVQVTWVSDRRFEGIGSLILWGSDQWNMLVPNPAPGKGQSVWYSLEPVASPEDVINWLPYNNASATQFPVVTRSVYYASEYLPVGSTLDDLDDVTAPNPEVGEGLVWNGTAWANMSVPFYKGMMSGPPASGDYVSGDWINTYSGDTWTCINSGNPGIWQTPNQDVFEDELMAPPCHYSGERVYPGAPSTPTVMTTGRAYAVMYPLSQRAAITHIRVAVTGAGYDGAKILAGVYEDNHGNPKKRLAYGEVAVGTAVITAAKIGGVATMTIPLNVQVAGGRWIWIVLLAIDGSGAEPVVQFMNSSPYYPSVGIGYPSLTYNGFGLYKDSYTALPERYNKGGFPYGSVINAVPRFSMAFAIPSTLPQREPDRHLALGPTLVDESNCLQEPNVYYDASRDANERYVMTYTIRWGSPALAWATAPSPLGPWTKKGVFWEESLGKSSLLFDDGVLYVYSCGDALTVRSGTNPGDLGAASTCMTAAQGGAGSYQNTHVLKRGVGDYVLFVEANVALISWATGYATATSPLGPFTMQTFPIAGLARHPSSTYGGPCCNYVGGSYKMYIHSGEGGVNPTEIYYCTSSDLVTWTGSENPIIRRESRWEVDQVADPHFFRDPETGIGYLYWDALDNIMPRSVIMVSNPNVLTIDG